jgi:hypothetical protein
VVKESNTNTDDETLVNSLALLFTLSHTCESLYVTFYSRLDNFYTRCGCIEKYLSRAFAIWISLFNTHTHIAASPRRPKDWNKCVFFAWTCAHKILRKTSSAHFGIFRVIYFHFLAARTSRLCIPNCFFLTTQKLKNKWVYNDLCQYFVIDSIICDLLLSLIIGTWLWLTVH